MTTKPTTHETTSQHEAHASDKSQPPVPKHEAQADPHVLMEGTGGIKVARFTLNGQVKSLNLPVTGAELHRIAGGAQKLTVNGKAVANDSEPLDLADDAAVTATY